MLILNPPFSDEKFFKASSFEDIKRSPHGAVLFFDRFKPEYLDLFAFCKKSDVAYGVRVKSVKEFIFIANLKAKYAFCSNLELAKKLQEIAETYLLSTKVILLVEDLEGIESAAQLGIDGVFQIKFIPSKE
jgi:hypothetical protein